MCITTFVYSVSRLTGEMFTLKKNIPYEDNAHERNNFKWFQYQFYISKYEDFFRYKIFFKSFI